ncbi:hypothetical protein N9M27_04950 [Flavobacteriales bacterium]|nr:hypothetical protein [Flavobacteriales bacterium]
MKKTTFFTLILLFLLPIAASSQEYSDLLSLLVSEEYEKVLRKSNKYIQNDNTKKDPLPYLYFSEASYRMSLDNKFSATYPKAYKSALSYAVKFRKKDKTNAYWEDAIDYFEELRYLVAEEVENYISADTEKGYKKGLSLIKKMSGFSPEDKGLTLTRAVLEVLSGNKSEGRKMIVSAWKSMAEIGTGNLQFEEMSEQTQYNLRFSLMQYAKYAKKTDIVKAQTIIAFGHPYFYNENEDYQKDYSEEYKDLYDDLHN